MNFTPTFRACGLENPFFLNKSLTRFILKSFFIILIAFISNSVGSKTKFSNFEDYQFTDETFKLIEITDGLNYPWGMTFINDQDLIITEKKGNIIKVNTSTGEKKLIKHNVKNIKYSGQGGLLDILYHKDGFLYFTYSYGYDSKIRTNTFKESSTAIARGRLENDELKDTELLFLAKPRLYTNKHFGSRIAIKDEYLFASIGERGMGMIAQNPTKHPGSFIRIMTNGDIPKDNPYILEKKKNWLPEIFQIGLRNPQGITISPHDGEIYFSNHGPRGGDSIGVVKFSGNYGWKNIAWGGTEYSGKKIGKSALNDIYDKPVKIWVPSIGIGNLTFYNGKTFPDWIGDLLITATGSKMLIRLDFNNGKITREELILKDKIGRIRDLEIDSSGDIYLIIDEFNSKLWKITK
mgnify:CR=1 FL=1